MNINVHLIIQNVIFITLLYAYSVKCVPCYLSMVHPQVVDGGDGLQMWKKAVKFLNKQLQSV